MHLTLVLLLYRKRGYCRGRKYFLTAFKILENVLEDVLGQLLQMVRSSHTFYWFFVYREQLFFYFNASTIIKFGVNLLFFYKSNTLKDCLHLDAFISDIQQVLQGLITYLGKLMKLNLA